ncbi:MAG: hypothetical protein U0936_27505 [Planctomycetaceae bacterium]
MGVVFKAFDQELNRFVASKCCYRIWRLQGQLANALHVKDRLPGGGR